MYISWYTTRTYKTICDDSHEGYHQYNYKRICQGEIVFNQKRALFTSKSISILNVRKNVFKFGVYTNV